MTDHRKVFPPADLKMNWFQEPLRDHTDLDDRISFALSERPAIAAPSWINQGWCASEKK